MPGMTTDTSSFCLMKRSASVASSIAPPASGFMQMKPTPCSRALRMSASPCVSTMLYGNITVSTQGSVSARSKTDAMCAVRPMWRILPAAFAASSASSAPPGAHTVSSSAIDGLCT